MKQIINRLLLALSTFGILLAPISTVALTHAADADIDQALCAGASLSTDTSNCNIDNADEKVQNTVANVINLFSWVVGSVAVIMIMVGGFQYITAAGNDQKVGTAKNTILYAIIGLVVVAIAQVVVKFVISRASSAVN